MYDFISTLYATPGGAALGALIACSIFAVVTFGLYKWVNRERHALDTEERIGKAQPR